MPFSQQLLARFWPKCAQRWELTVALWILKIRMISHMVQIPYHKRSCPLCVYFPFCHPFLSNRLDDLDHAWQEGGHCQCLYESWKSRWAVTLSGFHIINKVFYLGGRGFKHFCRPFLSNRLADLDQILQKCGYCQWLYKSRKHDDQSHSGDSIL